VDRLKGEGPVVRVAPCILVIAICLSQAGCKMLGKKSAGASKNNNSGDQAAARPERDFLPPLPDRTSPPVGVNGFLAGQVIDAYNRHPGGATIQVVEAANGGPVGAPIEVHASNEGFFTVQGLQPGKLYQITARARDGSRMLAGMVVATPPDPRVLVRVMEDMGAIPPQPNWPDKNGKGAEQGKDPLLGTPPNPNDNKSPGSSAQEQKRGAEIGPPPGSQPPPDQPEPRSEIRRQDTAQQQVTRADVPALIPRWTPTERIDPVRTVPAEAPAARPIPPPASFGPARVPSCVLTGETLHNFALYDLQGRPWEFRNRQGRLVLLDFWGTWCLPCRQAIPHLNILHESFGPYGLEVIGIAYEDGTPTQRVEKVNRVCKISNVRYRMLMGADRYTCPVRVQFAVNSYPTLVLLDENGRIIWRGEGNYPEHFQELDIILRQRLWR
jgi:thiol-disulfide isomerase/thioredoxin